jgi:hypothetical protein
MSVSSGVDCSMHDFIFDYRDIGYCCSGGRWACEANRIPTPGIRDRICRQDQQCWWVRITHRLIASLSVAVRPLLPCAD